MAPPLTFANRPRVVFVVEDDPDLRLALADVLAAEGLCAVLFPTAQTLLSSLDGDMPAAIITDLVMPGMSGVQLLGVLRSDDRWRGVPVVVMTGTNDTALPVRLDVPIVYKPDLNGLLRALAAVLGPHRTTILMETVHDDEHVTNEDFRASLARWSSLSFSLNPIMVRVSIDYRSLEASKRPTLPEMTYRLAGNARSAFPDARVGDFPIRNRRNVIVLEPRRFHCSRMRR